MKFLITALITLLVVGGLIEASNVPVTEEPKQSPYVIAFEVCGAIQYVVATTTPPIGIGIDDVYISPEMDELLQNVPDERIVILKHWDTFCPLKT